MVCAYPDVRRPRHCEDITISLRDLANLRYRSSFPVYHISYLILIMKYSIIASVLAVTVSAKKCQQIKVPVTATARNGAFDITAPGLLMRMHCMKTPSI